MALGCAAHHAIRVRVRQLTITTPFLGGLLVSPIEAARKRFALDPEDEVEHTSASVFGR